jgi:hypothetical protein
MAELSEVTASQEIYPIKRLCSNLEMDLQASAENFSSNYYEARTNGPESAVKN